MGAPLLPEHRVKKLTEQGKTPTEIAKILLEQDHLQVTPNSISMWRKRHGYPPLKLAGPKALLPWAIKSEHVTLHWAAMLRAEERLRDGRKLTELTEKRLKSFKQTLEENDAVVHYDPDTVQGWFFVPRRHGIDKDLIRDPKYDDDGNIVRK